MLGFVFLVLDDTKNVPVAFDYVLMSSEAPKTGFDGLAWKIAQFCNFCEKSHENATLTILTAYFVC